MAISGKPAKRWSRWTKAGLIIGGLGLLLLLLSALLYGAGAAPLRIAFMMLPIGGVLGLIGLIICVVRAVIAYRKVWMGEAVSLGLLSLLLLFAVGTLGKGLLEARQYPPLHDVTTNLDYLPEFNAITLREDLRKIVPDGGREDLKALEPDARWRVLHAEAYPDLEPLKSKEGIRQTLAAAERVARDMGWEIVSSNPNTGRLEAVDTTFWFRFKDDVVVRVMANPDVAAGGTFVDVRSVSQVGIGDVGANAKRIRAFLAKLSAELGG